MLVVVVFLGGTINELGKNCHWIAVITCFKRGECCLFSWLHGVFIESIHKNLV